MIRIMFASLLVAGVQGATGAGPRAPLQQEPVIIEIRKADGTVVARSMAWQGENGLQIVIQSAGMAPGTYGAHLHAVGRCEGPDFESAGEHWNPGNRQHGTQNPQGHHRGDLPNFEIDANGAGRLEFTIGDAEVDGAAGLRDADGTAVLIHASPDDHRTDPGGSSGARIACGVFPAR